MLIVANPTEDLPEAEENGAHPLRPTSRTLPILCLILFSWFGATACTSSGGAVALLISSNAPVKPTATQLRGGMLQVLKDWADAKTRIEDIHTRRVAEMLAIEADIAFMEEVAKIDAQPRADGNGLNPGRLERLLGLKASDPTFEQEVLQALEPTKRSRGDPLAYFRDYLSDIQRFLEPQSKENDRFTVLWKTLSQLTGGQIQEGPDMARWLVSQKLTSWSELVTRFNRRGKNGAVVADGANVVEAIRAASHDLGFDPPDISEVRFVTGRTIARLRHRREQFPTVDRLLSNLLTIARDLDTYLQHDIDAIHWREVGQAIGKIETISTEVNK